MNDVRRGGFVCALTFANMVVGCSGEPGPVRGTAEAVDAPNAQSAAASGGVASSSAAERGDYSSAIGIAAPPGAQCSVFPEGGSAGDPVLSEVLQAHVDGMVRFYAPPQATWGTRLTLDCTMDGRPLGRRTVDLGAPSTFTALTPDDLAGHPTGFVRPPLTGDLSSISRQYLREHGYPSRPDAATPSYDTWLRAVTRPMTQYDLVPVAALGRTGGIWKGSENMNWTGSVQAAASFGCCSPSFYANEPNSNSGWYGEYVFVSYAPNVGACGSGSCNTVIWGGIGGFPVNVGPFGILTSSLMQSGWNLVGTGASGDKLYWEYAPGSGNHVANPPLSFNVGDEFLDLGWSSSQSNCSDVALVGSYGCFEFEDVTAGWYFQPATPLTNPTPASNPGAFFLPSTLDFVAEKTGGQPNADYGVVIYSGGAYDLNGGYHAAALEPGWTDDYITVQQTDGSGNLASWGYSNFFSTSYFLYQNP